ncbi:hypothetical protein PHET_11968 [Paragonimus heterotremus]|uniref:Uncharacterized protein n=1 Tax=Paragonimus heterotremus TaxID=100268 RepID=A0A8J4SY46_9TREM|nr:hypothetical protein PHET_11968 [Paragonimus heterotremus]
MSGTFERSSLPLFHLCTAMLFGDLMT